MIVIFLLTAVVLLVAYYTKKAWEINQHWKNAGIVYAEPILFFGNMLDTVLKRRTQGEVFRDIYNAFPGEPVVGFYYFLSPRLLIRDLGLLERVLIKDFQHFVDRGEPVDVKNNPLDANLFGLTGSQWKACRAKLSPMFTSGKLRFMLPQINDIADKFMAFLNTNNQGQQVNIKDESSRFTMEVIGSTVFGIESGALESEDSEFRRNAKACFSPNFLDFVRMCFLFSVPKLAEKLGFDFIRQSIIDYFTNVIRSTLQYRKTNKAYRNDFVQLMVTLQEKGSIDVEKNDHDELTADHNLDCGDNSEALELTDEFMVGQAFVFMVAGFESTSSALAFMCMEFAANPTVQEKARDEVMKAMSKGGELYDVLKDLKYLDACLKETLRLHPPVDFLIRMCMKKYEIPEDILPSQATIPHGDYIVIPTLGIHSDPEIYPEPEKFLPERWSEDVRQPPCTYLPFGDGPRMCIGRRFGEVEVKCGIAKFLMNYRMIPHPDAKMPMKINPYSFVGSTMKPMLCNLEKLES